MILEIVSAGLLGTLFMSSLMTMIHRSEWANADMIRALGSLLTRKYETALLPGLLIHVVAGITFAFGYAALVGLILADREGGALVICVVMGLIHGIVVGLVLMGLVSERHPVERFQKAEIEVIAAHVAGHVAYGLGVGLVLNAFDVRWSVMA